jgi:Mrp family chromosome partitioning ATPase
MSKNFELLQRVSKEREIVLVPEPQTLPAPVNGNGNGNGHYNGAGLNLDRLAREECLRLVQRIFLQQAAECPRAVVFAGVDHGNGCSRACASMAEMLAANTHGSVCVVDANLRSPSLPRFFGVTNHRGLTDVMFQGGPVRNFARQLRPENLWLLSCGAPLGDSRGLFHSDRLKALLAELRKEFDHVLIDAPPLSQYADAVTLGQLTDGVVLVVEANSTRRGAALNATQNLRAAQIQVLGAILNKRTYPIPESLYQKL